MSDTLMQLNTTHKSTYDQLADEYYRCADDNQDVVNDAMSKLAQYVPAPADVLDVGCAVGNIAESLLRMGYSVDGIDIAPKMIDIARKRAPGGHFFVGDVCDFQFHRKYDAIVAFAFIHLFPRDEVGKVIEKLKQLLKPGGYIYSGTTSSDAYSEGYEYKQDYKKKMKRFRARWPRRELDAFLDAHSFEIIHVYEHTDVKGKVWMDYVLQLKEAS